MVLKIARKKTKRTDTDPRELLLPSGHVGVSSLIGESV